MGFEILSERGRKYGKRYKTREARENWTSICVHVVNRGKWKSRCFGENIHVLY